MIAIADIADVFRDFAAACHVHVDGEDAPRQVDMITQSLSSGRINTRNNLLAFMDTSTMPAGADWGYGLIRAEDAPAGMTQETKMTVTDSAGRVWRSEAAMAVCDIDPENRRQRIIAWRLALRGKQRMVRGGR